MIGYIVRRLIYMVVVVALISIVAFIMIQLPPGDYLTGVIDDLRSQGVAVSEELVELLGRQFDLGLPFPSVPQVDRPDCPSRGLRSQYAVQPSCLSSDR